jgi:hypothetical protein
MFLAICIAVLVEETVNVQKNEEKKNRQLANFMHIRI